MTGVVRSTFVLDEQGNVAHALYDVPPAATSPSCGSCSATMAERGAVLRTAQPPPQGRRPDTREWENDGVDSLSPTDSPPVANGQPLRDSVRERIRRGIADGRWTAGARLVERELADEFSVSRVPVREALQMLQREGFVELLPRRGAVVRQLTPAVVSDLFDIRQALEVLAARQAAERIDDDGLERLATVLDDGRKALAANDHAWSGSANTAFHETLLDLAGNEPLRDLLEPLSGRLKWLFRQTHDYSRVQAEHEQLFTALSARDAELAGAIALAHVRASRHMVLDSAPYSAPEAGNGIAAD